MKRDIYVNKTGDGGYEIFIFHHNTTISRQYMGYTRKEALGMFKEYLKKEFNIF